MRNRIEQRLSKAPARRKKSKRYQRGEEMNAQKRRLLKSGRASRSIDSQGCEHLAQAKRDAKRFGITVSAKRLAGRSVKDDAVHVQFRLRGYVVADFWPACGKLRIAGLDRTAEGILEAVLIVGRTIENTEGSHARRDPRTEDSANRALLTFAAEESIDECDEHEG